MRFEVNTDYDRFSKSLSLTLIISICSFFSVVFTNISISLTKISRSFEIENLCKIILVDKSSKNFKKLSKLTNQVNKQKIWDICREISK